jgi:hypothetical protein
LKLHKYKLYQGNYQIVIYSETHSGSNFRESAEVNERKEECTDKSTDDKKERKEECSDKSTDDKPTTEWSYDLN